MAANALGAHDAGATGSGVKIAIVDTGINPDLAEFSGRIDAASRDVAANRPLSDDKGHGTRVAALAAAARDDMGIEGVAFQSTIVALRADTPGTCGATEACTFTSANLASAIDAGRESGARVINLSIGGPGGSQVFLDAVGRAVAAGIVVVLAAGNDGDPEPDGTALLTAQQFGSLVIIAGSHDASRAISSFSDRAGSGADFYLTALGRGVTSLDRDGSLGTFNGTSFSAPVISAAVALLAQAFPNLTGAQIVDLLYRTADDAGAVGTDPVYGHGILNIGRAFQPQGNVRLAGSAALIPLQGQASAPMGDASAQTAELAGAVIVDGYGRAFTTTLAQTLRRAARDRPLERSLLSPTVAAMLGMGGTIVSLTVDRRPYAHPEIGFARWDLSREDERRARLLASLVVSRITPRLVLALGISDGSHDLVQRLASSRHDDFLIVRDPMAEAGFYGAHAISGAARLELGGIGFTAAAELGEVRQSGQVQALSPRYRMNSLTLDRRLGPLILTAGIVNLREAATILGGALAQEFDPGGATSWFMDMSARLERRNGWGAFLRYRRGATHIASGGAFARGGSLASSAWAIDLDRRGALMAGDRIALRVARPLRIQSGGFHFSLPVFYDYRDSSVGYETRFFNLAPFGKEIDLEAVYSLPLLGGRLNLSGFARRQPGNIRASASEIGGLVQFGLNL